MNPGPPVVDLGRLSQWMDEAGLPPGSIEDVTPLEGGTQNVLLRFRRGDEDYVLRRPPINKRPNSDKTMLREARVLAALANTDVPHPELVRACDDVEVLGATFYLMRPVSGFNPDVALPETHLRDLDLQHRMGLAMVDALASLGDVDPDAVGLGDLGRREGWLERQVDRWSSQLESYGDPGRTGGLPHVATVRSWLSAHRPTSWRPGLLHGDYQFSNVLFQHDRPELAAIVDWELTTIADPLLDLGHLLATWPVAQQNSGAIRLIAPGLPTRAELVARYEARSPRDLRDLPWFRILACYRLGIILEGSNVRAATGATPPEVGDRLHQIAVRLFEQADELIRA